MGVCGCETGLVKEISRSGEEVVRRTVKEIREKGSWSITPCSCCVAREPIRALLIYILACN